MSRRHAAEDAFGRLTLAVGRNVNVTVPFPVESIEHSVHKTYLDSIGRPRVTITKRMCVEKHEQDIFVSPLFLAWCWC